MIQLRWSLPKACTRGMVETVTIILPPGPQKMRQAWVEARDFSSRVMREAMVE